MGSRCAANRRRPALARSLCHQAIANFSFCEPVFPNCRTGLLHAETEIGKTRAETGAAKPRFVTGNPENPSLETGRLRPNSPKCRWFSHIRKQRRRDRIGWLGREDSNLRMAESKSTYSAFYFQGHS